MSETMSHVERVLWRIAELGARCSQQAATGERGPLWAELEQTIAGLEDDFEAARQAVDIAPEQVRTLEGRLKVAQQERDREKAKVRELVADAEAARRERDRAVEKARKAIAITTEAKSAALEARSTAAECVARASAAENTARKAMAARAQAVASRDEAVNALAEALTSRDRAVNALADAVATGERAADARDEALGLPTTPTLRALEALQRPHHRTGSSPRGGSQANRMRPWTPWPPGPKAPSWCCPACRSPTLRSARSPAAAGLTGSRHGRSGPAPTAPTSPMSPARWSTSPEADEIHLDDSKEGEEVGEPRYLNVAATIAQLLPQDLGPLLLSGTTVVRREGRLCATVAVARGTPTPTWHRPNASPTPASKWTGRRTPVWASRTLLNPPRGGRHQGSTGAGVVEERSRLRRRQHVHHVEHALDRLGRASRGADGPPMSVATQPGLIETTIVP